MHYLSTAKVRVPRAASWSPTWAVALPRPIGPRTWSISHVEHEHVSRLDHALETAVVDTRRRTRSSRGSPPRRARRPLRSAPSPRRSGRPASQAARESGPANHGSSARTSRRATTRRPGSSSSTSSMSRNGVAVRQDLLDLRAPERDLEDSHARSLLGRTAASPGAGHAAADGPARVPGGIPRDDADAGRGPPRERGRRLRASATMRSEPAVHPDLQQRRLADPDPQRLPRQDPDDGSTRVRHERQRERARRDGVGRIDLEPCRRRRAACPAASTRPSARRAGPPTGRPTKSVATHVPPRSTRTRTVRRIEQREPHREPVRATVAVRRERRRRDGDGRERARDEHGDRSRDGPLRVDRVDAERVRAVRRARPPQTPAVCVPAASSFGPGKHCDVLPARVDHGHGHRRGRRRRVRDRRRVGLLRRRSG